MLKYWEEDSSMGGHTVIAKKEVTKENIRNTLEFIKRGYLPDWNYEKRTDPETGESLSLPNEYYPLHMAMQVALKAVDAMDDDFFKELDKEYEKYSKVGGHAHE